MKEKVSNSFVHPIFFSSILFASFLHLKFFFFIFQYWSFWVIKLMLNPFCVLPEIIIFNFFFIFYIQTGGFLTATVVSAEVFCCLSSSPSSSFCTLLPFTFTVKIRLTIVNCIILFIPITIVPKSRFFFLSCLTWNPDLNYLYTLF